MGLNFCRCRLPVRMLLFGLFLLIAASCSSLSATAKKQDTYPDTSSLATVEAAKLYWWHARFITPLAAKEEPRWVSDLMAAHLVIEPVIGKFASSLALWRFHRRAVPDAAGHVFSFIFYADRHTAEQVFALIDQSPDLARLMRHGLIARYENNLVAENKNSDLKGSSDGNWSLPLQEVWPAYIMGASVMWLGLINQYLNDAGAADRDFDEQVAEYEKVNTALEALWRNEGEHAFLHHLNALFGYAPMLLEVETNF